MIYCFIIITILLFKATETAMRYIVVATRQKKLEMVKKAGKWNLILGVG